MADPKVLSNSSSAKKSYPFFDVKQMLTSPLSETVVEHYCKPILPKGGILAFIAGEPKVGKTFLSVQFAYSLACGAPFLKFSISKPVKVLYIDLEDSEVLFKKRIKDMSSNFPLLREGFFKAVSIPHIDISKDLERIEATINESEAEIVFIDSFSRLNFGDENKSDEMIEALTKLDEIRQRSGVTIVLIHHLRKVNTSYNSRPEKFFDRLRGSGVLFAWGSTYIGVSKHLGKTKLEFELRHNKALSTLPIKFNDKLIFESPESPINTAVLRCFQDKEEMQQSELATLLSEQINQSERNCERLLKEAAEDGFLIRREEGNRVFYRINIEYK